MYVLLAALLWSTSGAFTKLLTQPTALASTSRRIDPYLWAGYRLPLQIACYRTLFAGLVLVPTLRPRDMTFRWLMVVMALLFTTMNATFITAMALGTAANAILLQYSAPLWVYLAGIFWLGEKPDWRSTLAMWLGLVGIGIIVAGGWNEGDLGRRRHRARQRPDVRRRARLPAAVAHRVAEWLTVWNHLLSGAGAGAAGC